MTEEPASADDAEEAIPVDHAFVCEACGRRWYYDRRRCPDCDAASASTTELGTGKLVAVTTVEMTPPDVRAPNPLGIARFDDVQVLAQMADSDLSPGDAVRFGGAYRLREGRDSRDPRLVAADRGSSDSA